MSDLESMPFLPVPFMRMPPRALDNLPIYLRTDAGFTLYASAQTPFTAEHRRRLAEIGVRFVYLPEDEVPRFYHQIENDLDSIPGDDSLSEASKSEIIYDTSVELVSELLINPNLAQAQPRLQRVARTIALLVLRDPHSFANLFIATHHDAHLATHLVNVGAWMASLARSMGTTDEEELATICLAGLLHDIGKIFVPADLLITPNPLTDENRADLQQHAQLGAEFIRRHTSLDDRVARVAEQHHERIDGTGYPAGLRDADIDPLTRLCSVVDAFDAMTAFRPYRPTTRSAAETLAILQEDTPLKLDRRAMDAWAAMVRQSHPDLGDETPQESAPMVEGKRRFRRHRVRCVASVQLLSRANGSWRVSPQHPATAHNISQDGLGLLSHVGIQPGQYVRVVLLGEGALARTLDAIAVRCRHYPADLHDIGLRVVDLTAESRTLSAENILYIRNRA